MLRTLITTCSFALAISANAAQAQTRNPQPNSLSTRDQQFVTAAMSDQLFEINVSVLAQVNGGSEKVQRFGEMVEKDLCHHWPELVDTAKKLGLSPPREIGATEKPVYVYL